MYLDDTGNVYIRKFTVCVNLTEQCSFILYSHANLGEENVINGTVLESGGGTLPFFTLFMYNNCRFNNIINKCLWI